MTDYEAVVEKPLEICGGALEQLLSSIKKLARPCFSRPKVKEPNRTDYRVYQRFPIFTKVTCTLPTCGGKSESLRGRGLNISRLGALVKSSKPLPPDSYVFVQFDDLKLMGSAQVRHCIREGWRYKIGLEFRKPLMES